MKHTSFAH